MTIEEKIKRVKELHANTPNGVIRDADTILLNVEEVSDLEVTGIAQEIFDIYEHSSDKSAVTDLFATLTGMSFEDYLDKCIEEITRQIALTQEQAREIIQALPSLYSLQSNEEEAILALLSERECQRAEEGNEDRAEFEYYCPNCSERIWNSTDRFCHKCGQPLAER